MTKGLISTLICIVSMFVIVSGCTNAQGKASDKEKNLFTTKVESVKQVSVLTTDGQEIVLDIAHVKTNLPQTTQEIYRSTDRLQEADVRYTLLAYRGTQAPLVIEIGENACQFEDVTYRGKDAQTFYQKIAELTGQALLSGAHLQSIEISALDKKQEVTLTREQTGQFWQMIKQASYQVKPEVLPFPLFPHYQLELDFGDRIRVMNLLTPSLATIQVGDDILYYRVPSSLFSLLTEYIVPQPSETDEIDYLFKSDKITMTSADGKNVIIRSLANPILWESLAHQFVRMIKEGMLVTEKSLSDAKIKYKITLYMGDTKKEITVYSTGFSMEGKMFLQPRIIRQLEELTSQYKILEKSS